MNESPAAKTDRDYPSIFNDAIGPVMRGPSSSHCAAALRIGRLARDLMEDELREVRVTFDPAGSLATTHESQGCAEGSWAGRPRTSGSWAPLRPSVRPGSP
jgi:L-serine dehydratase